MSFLRWLALVGVLGGCGGGSAALQGSTAPLHSPPAVLPFVPGSFAPLPPQWGGLAVEALVQPWHRFVIGGMPTFSTAGFGVGVTDAATAATGCQELGQGDGEVNVFYADGNMRRGVFVLEYLAPASTRAAAKSLDRGRVMANGWTEYGLVAAPDSSLFGRPGAPWVCATGADIRDRVRATLAQDSRVPVLANVPYDVSLISVHSPCPVMGCLAELQIFQIDQDVRTFRARLLETKQLPTTGGTLLHRHEIHPSAAAAQSTLAKYNAIPDPQCRTSVRGADLFQTCHRLNAEAAAILRK